MNTKTDNTMQDTQLDGMYRMASKFLGYSGPKTKEALEQFRQSSPAVAAKMKRYNNAMAKGGLMQSKGYASGGIVDPIEYAIRDLPEETRAEVRSRLSRFSSMFQRPQPRRQEPADPVIQALTSRNMPPEALEAYQKAMGTYTPPAPEQKPTLNQQIAASLPNFPQGMLLSTLNEHFPQGSTQEDAMAEGGLMQPKGYATGGTVTKTSSSSPSNLPNYQAFLNSPQYQQAQGQAASQVITPVTVGGQTYNFGNPVLAQAYQNFAASQSSSTPATTTSTTSTTPTPSQAGATPFQQAPALPAQPTLQPIPPNATDEEKKKIEDANKALQDKFKQDSMAALAQAQQQTVMSSMTPYRPEVAQIQETTGQIVSPTTGQATTAAPTATAAQTAATAQAQAQQATPAAQAGVTTTAPAVQQELSNLYPAYAFVSPPALAQAQTQTQSAVSGLQAAQGAGIMMNNPAQRQIQAGELVSEAANAQVAAQFTEQVQAATASPTKQATVAGQLEERMKDFAGGATPAWAAGAMREAQQVLAARGLGASSMAGQAVIQAAMEAALPIAQADAATVASFEAQNLSNRQQRAMLAAQQRAEFLGQEFNQAFQARVANAARIADAANMNFTAEQQVALENSRIANTINLENLGNRQAMVMAEAASLSQLDMANLSNRQQAAVQNAQAFLQADMTTASNEQQVNMFRAQQNIQALFTDQAAENAAQQFNATSENQTNQFFASLAQQTSQFNASQTNAMNQFNTDAANSIRTFNAELQQQRDLFNAQNSLVVEQANATWRQNLATLNTAAQNEANMTLAQTLNALTMSNIDQIWQRERDLMSYSIQTANNNADRATQIAIQKLANEAAASTAASQASGAKSAAFASAAGSIVSSIILG